MGRTKIIKSKNGPKKSPNILKISSRKYTVQSGTAFLTPIFYITLMY